MGEEIDEVIDAVWLACAIDGEGGVELDKDNRRPSVLLPEVIVHNTCIEFIEEACRIMQTKIEAKPRSVAYYKEEWKTGYFTRTRKQRKIKEILELTLPFMIVKKKQAELLLEWVNIRINLHNGKSHLERETEIYYELKELNKRGRNLNAGKRK